MKLLIILLILIIAGLILVIINLNSAIKHLKTKSWKKKQPKIELSLQDAKNIILDTLATAYSRIDSHPSANVIRIKEKKIRSAIIGQNGRNLQLIEKLTGSDITFDNSDDVVIVSCFNPIKREIATTLLQELIASKKINAKVIEEAYEQRLQKTDKIIFNKGKKAFNELNLKENNEDIIYNVGKLYFRYSYGQNVLAHSIETAKIMGSIAREYDLDLNLAKRSGLLHDIGKAFDIEKEGSHVDLGVEYARGINEDETVIDSIASHHSDKVASTVISAFVQFADMLSASRPAARKKTKEKLLTRVAQMEGIAKRHIDVKDAYVIKGGKEIRVIIKAKSESAISDIAQNIKNQFENKLKFPGVIKIVAIKENRYSTEALQNKSR